MKKLFKKTIIVLSSIFIGIGQAFSSSDNATYSGYYVNRIILNTTELFLNKGLLKENSDTFKMWTKYQDIANRLEEGDMLPIFPFFDFEQSFINYCIGKKFITTAQANIAIDKSKNCGGLTSNGYNLLVLHAYILSDLVDNKFLTLKEAQTLLDSCRKKK